MIKPLDSHLLLLLVLLVGSYANADETEVIITETKPAGNGSAANSSVGGDGVSDTMATGSSPSIDYTLHASFDSQTAMTLRTTTSLDVTSFEADDDTPEALWNSVDATVRAKSSIAAFGVVQNVGAATSGTVEFQWSLDGDSNLSLMGITDANVAFEAVTTLTARSPLTDFELVREEYALNAEGNIMAPAAAGPFVLPTAPTWTAGSQIPVFFDLESTLTLNATSTGGIGSYEADGSLLFGNSATLTPIIRDQLGNQIVGATLQLTSVPEPSSAAYLAALALVLVATQAIRRKVRRRAC